METHAAAPARSRARPRRLARTLLALLGLGLCLGAGSASALSLELTDRSPHARYAVWVTTSLDLTAPGQPVHIAPLDEDRVDIELPFDGESPHWVFLSERFQPTGGPPVDLLLPVSLFPLREEPEGPLRIASVDPELLTRHERLSFAPSVLRKLLLVVLLVMGGGFGLRMLTRDGEARAGRRCAPLSSEPVAAPSWSQRGVLAILAALVALRLPGFFGESLDLLEVSYLPGIGRPAPFAEGASGLAGVGPMLRELAALYCLDLTHPPLYHGVMGVMGLLGDAEWLLRIPALFASLGTAWLAWTLGRRVSEAAGLTAASLVAVAAPSVYFGQDATPYAFVGLVALGATHLLLRALETGSLRHWRGFFGLLVAGFLSHYNVAPFGMALCVLLLFWVIRGWGERRWRAALHLAMGQGLLLAPLPLLWSWLHFSTFETVAQDTRLVADTYMPDPGWASFLADFVRVSAGLNADGLSWPLLGAIPLLVLGVHALWRGEPSQRLLAEVLLVLGLTFVGSTLFFYLNAREYLGGRVFYGFRWVGWYHPVLLATAALGAIDGAGPRALRGALLGVWMLGVLPATGAHLGSTSRPDYRGATEIILAELEDGDAIASLPAWFQRGNLAYYLFQSGLLDRDPMGGEGSWKVGRGPEAKRLTLEAVHAGLPFETTARSGHIDRLWVAVVRETMFGRDKFDPAVASQAIAWADAELEPDGVWELERLTLHRYRSEGPLIQAPVVLSAADVPLMARTYPQIPMRGFEPPVRIAPRGPLGQTLRLQAPMTPSCLEEVAQNLQPLLPQLSPDADAHWALDLRLPGEEQRARIEGVGQMKRQQLRDGWRVQVVGGPCDGPPLRLVIE